MFGYRSTQCCQYLIEEALLEGFGESIQIICTQPRRVAAISVAERVAEELCDPRGIGATVGYQIRMEARKSSSTRVLFCTTGIILRRLQDDPTLAGVTHVLVDEVHERQQQTDVCLIALRRMLNTTRPDLKVVLVSFLNSVFIVESLAWASCFSHCIFYATCVTRCRQLLIPNYFALFSTALHLYLFQVELYVLHQCIVFHILSRRF